MIFRQWPSWLRWGVAFGAVYVVLGLYLYFGGISMMDPKDPNADLHMIPFGLLSFPGLIIMSGLSLLNIDAGSNIAVSYVIGAIFSLISYFLLGVGIGKVQEDFRAKRLKKH